jgi:hypothetical protein
MAHLLGLAMKHIGERSSMRRSVTFA